MVDAKVSKTFGPQDHAGSIPAPGTKKPRGCGGFDQSLLVVMAILASNQSKPSKLKAKT